MSLSLTHKYPTGVPQLIQEHNLAATFHRRTVSQLKISREDIIGNVDRGDIRLSSVTGVVAILSSLLSYLLRYFL